jgi:hypothetical protein
LEQLRGVFVGIYRERLRVAECRYTQRDEWSGKTEKLVLLPKTRADPSINCYIAVATRPEDVHLLEDVKRQLESGGGGEENPKLTMVLMPLSKPQQEELAKHMPDTRGESPRSDVGKCKISANYAYFGDPKNRPVGAVRYYAVNLGRYICPGTVIDADHR